MKIRFHKLMLMAAALALGSPAFAAGLPDYYPQRFDRWGIIDQVDLDNRILVINDVSVKIAHDLHVYTMNTRFAAPQALKRGMKVGFGTTGSRALTGAVSELWILPADYTPPPPGTETPMENERRKGRE